MKKLMYLIVAIVILGLIVSGCIPVVPPTEQGELGSQTKDGVTITVQLLDSNDSGLAGGVVQYYSGGWKDFGTTVADGKVNKDLSGGTYAFRISYAGASMQKSQNVASDPVVIFQTTKVTMKLLDSAGTTELAGGAEYYAGGYKTFGSGTTTTTMELLPVSYTFRVSYAGASKEKSQNVASDPVVIFQTTKVTMKLLDSAGTTELAGGAEYYAGGYKTFGSGTTTTTMELLPVSYTFRVSYAGASKEKSQNVASDPVVIFQTKLVTMKLLDSNSNELAGGAEYYAGGYKTFGSGTTTTTMELLPVSYTFRVSYAGASKEKSQNVASDPVVIFQTTKVTLQFSGQIQYYAGGWKTFIKPSMNLLPGTYLFKFDVYQMNINVSGSEMTKSIVIAKLLNSSGGGISGGAAQYYDSGWKAMGDTGSNGVLLYVIDGLKGTLSFKMTYAGASMQKNQNIASDSYVIFQTTEVTMKLLDSNNNELAGGAEYYASGWKTFGSGTTTTTMELLPVSYTFRVSYAGASMQKSQNVASDQEVVFNTTLVTMKLLDSAGTTELAGGAEYYASGWKTFGSGTTTTTMELLPVSYTFRVSYAGASMQKSQNVASDQEVVFNTTLVTMELLDSTGATLAGGAEYYAGGWKTFGTGTTTTTMELLPVSYTFRVSYAGASMQQSQNVVSDSVVIFQTTEVTMKLLDSNNSELVGGAEYYASGWKTFGSGTTTTTMELLPVSYTFRVSYAGASMQQSQNVVSDSVVVFNTAKVHSVSGNCTQYYASGWKAFIQDMELLPGSYTFRFSDSTPQTSYSIVTGTVNDIH